MPNATLAKISTLASLVSLISLSSILSTRPAQAAIINGGFDTGDFSGWTTLGDVSVQASLQALLKTENVNDNFAELEQFLGLAPGALDTLGNGEVFEGSSIKQSFTANAGQVLTFDWNFLTDETASNPDFNDFAFLTINNSLSELADTFSTFSTSQTPFARETGFKTFSYTIPTTGTYTLGIGVVDVNDPGTNSGLLVDNVVLSTISTPIPEPNTVFSLLAFGACSVGYRLLRKQKTEA